MTSTVAFPIIHINGYPGVGKLTIAKKLVDLLERCYGAKLVHNHLLIDPASAILPRSSHDYPDLRRAIRAAVFDTLAESLDTHACMYIFTESQTERPIDRSVMAEYIGLAKRRNCMLIPFTLTCSKEENLERLVASQRAMFGKLTDPELAANIRDSSQIYQWRDEPWHMELDITNLDAYEAAVTMCDHIVAVFEHG